MPGLNDYEEIVIQRPINAAEKPPRPEGYDEALARKPYDFVPATCTCPDCDCGSNESSPLPSVGLEYTPFQQALHEIEALHFKKQQDYGRPTDPFANVRASTDFGIPAWVGTLVRANDKMKRLQKAASSGTLANEGIEDSLMDLATYAIIALVLWREGLV